MTYRERGTTGPHLVCSDSVMEPPASSSSLHQRSDAVWCKMCALSRAGGHYHVSLMKGHIYGHSAPTTLVWAPFGHSVSAQSDGH